MPPVPGLGIVTRFSQKTPGEREAFVLGELLAGHTPNWLTRPNTWPEVDLGGELVVRVAPDVLGIGSDDEFLRTPLRPDTAQLYLDTIFSVLPTPKIADAVARAASVKLRPEPRPPGPDMVTSGAMVAHNEAMRRQLAGRTGFISGGKKDVVVIPGLDGRKVAIYGWFGPDGSRIQPLSTIHGIEHVDYSHGIRPVWRTATLHGATVDLVDLAAGADTVGLLADDRPPVAPLKPFPLRFPTGKVPAGSGASRDLARVRSLDVAESRPDAGVLISAAIPAAIAGVLVWAALQSGPRARQA